ncbi:MAG: hypothetical protein CMH26_01510 [Micavibrio sp.]|nr:hypothetical protein [Micavibrio sp.]|tara:strand:+ start:266 stop:598 length:333 start_codon:yes stop_codon:yes gene_type:complete
MSSTIKSKNLLSLGFAVSAGSWEQDIDLEYNAYFSMSFTNASLCEQFGDNTVFSIEELYAARQELNRHITEIDADVTKTALGRSAIKEQLAQTAQIIDDTIQKFSGLIHH